MPKVVAAAVLVSLSWGCAQRGVTPAATSPTVASSSLETRPQGHVSGSPAPVPQAELVSTEQAADSAPRTSTRELAQARAHGCVGLR